MTPLSSQTKREYQLITTICIKRRHVRPLNDFGQERKTASAVAESLERLSLCQFSRGDQELITRLRGQR